MRVSTRAWETSCPTACSGRKPKLMRLTKGTKKPKANLRTRYLVCPPLIYLPMAQNTDLLTSRNTTLFERAKALIPGGVNSPVRAFKAVGGTPRFIQRADGAYFWDADGKRYIDYIG